jgi:hypothetical protein
MIATSASGTSKPSFNTLAETSARSVPCRKRAIVSVRSVGPISHVRGMIRCWREMLYAVSLSAVKIRTRASRWRSRSRERARRLPDENARMALERRHAASARRPLSVWDALRTNSLHDAPGLLPTKVR